MALTANDQALIADLQALPDPTWTSDPSSLSDDDHITLLCGQSAFKGAKATGTAGSARLALIQAAAAALAQAVALAGGQ
jgi:hypothetical protein